MMHFLFQFLISITNSDWLDTTIAKLKPLILKAKEFQKVNELISHSYRVPNSAAQRQKAEQPEPLVTQ